MIEMKNTIHGNSLCSAAGAFSDPSIKSSVEYSSHTILKENDIFAMVLINSNGK